LIPYDAFRDALARLAATGAIAGQPGPDGSTMWHRVAESGIDDGHILG
jgi:hypothetical protein